ncbi:MAG: hypothetical protein JW769_05240 [Parachlamydiales bacterium]|nr:hypothetical protein [Parachlamydiales bacterium]
MNAKHAVMAYRLLQARYMIPIHWGSYQLSKDPLETPYLELMKIKNTAPNTEKILILPLGKSFSLDPDTL